MDGCLQAAENLSDAIHMQANEMKKPAGKNFCNALYLSLGVLMLCNRSEGRVAEVKASSVLHATEHQRSVCLDEPARVKGEGGEGIEGEGRERGVGGGGRGEEDGREEKRRGQRQGGEISLILRWGVGVGVSE